MWDTEQWLCRYIVGVYVSMLIRVERKTCFLSVLLSLRAKSVDYKKQILGQKICWTNNFYINVKSLNQK